MAYLTSALSTIVLPIFLVASVGFILRRRQLIVDSRPLARLTLYVFSPALALYSIATSHLSDTDLLALFAFAILIAALMGILSLLLARWLKFDRVLLSAFLLSIMFVNAGNIGLPFNQFAFGDAGLARAVIYFVANSILSQTLAIFIASSGHHGLRDSLIAVFKMPLVYAAVLGLILNRTGWVMPDALSRSVQLAADAAVPVMLVMLGLELARVHLADTPREVWLATGVKLLVTPAAALLLANVMHLSGLTRGVAVTEASMPTAVMASMIAVEFDTRSDFVTTVVLLTTVGSIVTLVALLYVLGYSG